MKYRPVRDRVLAGELRISVYVLYSIPKNYSYLKSVLAVYTEC